MIWMMHRHAILVALKNKIHGNELREKEVLHIICYPVSVYTVYICWMF